MNRKIILLLLLTIVFLSFFLLITGSGILLTPLVENPFVPLGNLITWAGITALPLSIYYGVRAVREPKTPVSRIYNRILKALIGFGAAWGLVAFALAGNFATNFRNQPGFVGSPRAAEYFWYYNYFVVLAPIAFLLIYVLHRLILGLIVKKKQGKANRNQLKGK